jgi:NitT/TauT family transport system permease protein
MGRYRSFLLAFLAHAAFVLVWHFAVVWSGVPKFIMPTPLDALRELFEPHYNWGTHIRVTTLEVFGGFGLAAVVGVATAVLFVWLPGANAALMPLLVTLNMVPKVAMAPLFVIWLGFGIVPNMVIAFTICFFPIVLTTYRGLIEVEPELINLVKSVRANRWQIFTKIQLPGSLPYLFSGMKVAAVLAVAGAIVGEFIASDRGLGNLLLIQQNMLNTGAMVMALILITLIGTALYGLVLALEWFFVTRKEVAK